MARDAAETRELKDSVAEYLKKSKFDKAAELLEELAAAEPKDMQHRLRLGDCYRRLGDPQKSVAQYEAAARHFAEEGQLIKAIATVKIVLEIEPRNSAAQKQLAGMNRQRRLGKTSPDLPSRAERSAAAPQARGASVAEAIEAIELADEPPAPAASGTVVTDKLPPAPSRGAQRGAMADRIQIELDPDDGAPMELEGVPKLTIGGTEPILASDSAAQTRPETDRQIQDLPDDAILDSSEEDAGAAAAEETFAGAPSSIADLLSAEAEEEIELISLSTERPDDVADVGAEAVGEDLEKAIGAIVPGANAAPRKLPTHVPLFDELPRDAFVELVNRLSYRRFHAGELILQEGQPGRSFYVIADGKVRIWKSMPDGSDLQLATLGEGEFFGEMALLSGTPRTANVSAAEDTEVLEISDAVLRRLAGAHPQFARSLKRFYRQRLLNNVMAISPLYKDFDPAKRKEIVEKFRLRQAAPAEIVIKEGSQSDGLYVVLHGAVEVAAHNVDLATLKEGDIFGEISLLTRQPATATVTSRGNCLLLRLPRDHFQELVVTHPQILALVSELSEQRAAATRAALEKHGISSFV